MKVGLMAGHGGREKGATALDGILLEKNANLEICQHILQQLNGMSWIEPVLLRSWDQALDRAEMKQRANIYGINLVVEIHHDSLPTNNAVHGLCCYYARENNTIKNVGIWTVEHSPLPLRGGRVICAHDDPDRDDDDWLVRPQTVVQCYTQDTLLVECCFLSNPKDFEFRMGPKAPDMIANSIVAGIIRYGQLKQGVA